MIQFAEFSQFPGGGLREQGNKSGQEFREDILAPALRDAVRNDGTVTVDLDGTMGLSTSFSREAFGGLIAHEGFTVEQLMRHLVIAGSEPASDVYAREAWDYIRSAKADRVVMN